MLQICLTALLTLAVVLYLQARGTAHTIRRKRVAKGMVGRY